MAYKELLDFSNEVQHNEALDCVNIAVVSNISFDPYFTPLVAKQFSDGSNLRSNIFPIPYEEYELSEYSESLSNSNLIIIWLNFDLLFSSVENQTHQAIDDIISLSKRVFDNITKYSNAKIIWFLFEDYYNKYYVAMGNDYSNSSFIDKINMNLINAINDNTSFIDMKRLIADVGIANTYDLKSKYRWNAPYSKALIESAVKEIHKQYLIEKGMTKKCLVLDCDNVLWGGILSEDGIENLKLGGSGFGRAYQDLQRFILSLYCHGVILAVCSKNDLSDVMTMFKEHSEMILKEEHIACFQVNWRNKPDNIKQISKTLNIGLDSIVFIDDSPIEIEAVKSMLPDVITILYDRDLVYEQLSCFNLKSSINITDIKKRNETYRTNQSREVLKSQYKNYSEFIDALEIKIDIHEAFPIEFSRISELTQRTNKCTNGKRYTVSEIKERVTDNNVKLYSLSVSDRFSDLGIIGALEIEADKLALFNLSCRALGREIEEKMLAFIIDKHRINKIQFISTGKNEEIRILLMKTFSNATLINNKEDYGISSSCSKTAT